MNNEAISDPLLRKYMLDTMNNLESKADGYQWELDNERKGDVVLIEVIKYLTEKAEKIKDDLKAQKPIPNNLVSFPGAIK